jgi:predicted site-specific integrase-resolvase
MALVKIGKAAKLLGVEVQTLYAWERSGELVPARRSKGGIRYYDITKITDLGLGNEDLPTIGYARVPGPGREADLSQQEESLEAFCAAKGWRHDIISDTGHYPGSPGPGTRRPGLGLKRLIELILRKRLRRLVLTHKDRLSQFGSELVFTLCELQNIEVVITNDGGAPPILDEEGSAQDEIEIRRLCERLIKGDRALSAPMPDDATSGPMLDPMPGDAASTSPAGGNGQDSAGFKPALTEGTE